MRKVSLISILFLISCIDLLAKAPDVEWTKTIGGHDSDIGYSVQQTLDGGYIIVGQTYSYGPGGNAVYIIKTDSVGDTLWTKVVEEGDYDRGMSVRQTTDGGYIITGGISTSYYFGAQDVYLIKLEPDEGGIGEDIISDSFFLYSADPNPFKEETIIRYEIIKSANVNISIYNKLGQKVKNLFSGEKSAGVYQSRWDGTDQEGEKLPGGVYLLILKAGNREANTKLIFVK